MMKMELGQNWADRPLGMSDVYPQAAKVRRQVESQLLGFFEAQGCDMVSGGVFEFVDTLSKGRSAIESNGWIQMFDASGRAVALRPEMTPSIARMAAPLLLSGQRDIRWCYAERIYRRSTDSASLSWTSGASAESTQTGVEWIGRSGVDVDAQLLSLCEAALGELGVSNWQIVVGHAGFTPALLTAIGVKADALDQFLQCLTDGDYVRFRNLTRDVGFHFDVLKLLSALNPYDEATIGNIAPHCDLSSTDAGRQALESWSNLVQLAQTLNANAFSEGISFDLTLHRDLTYYTGIVFEAFVPGVGAPIALGGRYDELLAHFGVSAPAIGFAFEVERIMAVCAPEMLSRRPEREER